MINLGVIATDNITGFEGIVIARATHLHGCVHITIQPKTLTDGVPSKPQVFDEQRIEFKETTQYEKPSHEPPAFLGSNMRDRFTKFEGIAHIYMQELFGQNAWYITPGKLKEDGSPIDGIWVNEPFIEIIEEKPAPVSKDSSAKTGSVFGIPAKPALPLR